MIAYFRSGWAFPIPYLAAYLLYAWLLWPVNVAAAGSWAPCLLHVYWTLHAINLVLGFITLRSWWKRRRKEEGAENHSAFQLFSSSAFSAAPWLCIGLLFWIPGIYLEWPADPNWHLERINRWHSLAFVRDHIQWYKSSYFLPYSLTGKAVDYNVGSGLELYYTGICLLLCCHGSAKTSQVGSIQNQPL